MDPKELITRGYESKSLDYKAPMPWDPRNKKACCELVKDILAIANTGGGFLVIGVQEKSKGQYVLVGLTEEDASTWETTQLNQFLASYAEPPINASLRKVEVEGKTFVVIGVPEFPNVPHICKKEYPEVLAAPALYVRTDANESAPVRRVNEFHALIELAVRKRGDAIIDTLRHILHEGERERHPIAEKQFAEQIQEFRVRFDSVAQFASDFQGWREFHAFPASFRSGLIKVEALWSAVQAADDNFGYVPLLYGPEKATKDGFEAHVAITTRDGERMESFWQVRDTGLLSHRELMREEARKYQGWPELPRPFLDTVYTCHYLARAIFCACRFFESLDLADDPITMRFMLFGTRGRRLLDLEPESWELGVYECALEEVEVKCSHDLQVWRASTVDITGEIMKEIAWKFNWRDPPTKVFKNYAEKLLTRKS